MCGSYCGRVVRNSLLGNCPGTSLTGRLLALRDVLLGFLSGSKRTARLNNVLGEVLRALSGPWRTRAHFLRFCPALFCRNVLIELAPDPFKLGSTANIAVHQREFRVS